MFHQVQSDKNGNLNPEQMMKMFEMFQQMQAMAQQQAAAQNQNEKAQGKHTDSMKNMYIPEQKNYQTTPGAGSSNKYNTVVPLDRSGESNDGRGTTAGAKSKNAQQELADVRVPVHKQLLSRLLLYHTMQHK